MIKDEQIAAYVRVSVEDQSASSQREALAVWLKNHGHNPDQIAWYEDHHTGKSFTRPEFSRLQEDIFLGRRKMVLVWKLNRVGRNLKEGMSTLHGWCDVGVRVVCTTMQLDLSGTIGQIVASVLFGIGEIELESTKEDQRRGIEAAKKRGIYTGRKKGTTKANPARAHELKQKGLSNHEIAQALSVTPRTVANYLKQ